MSFDRAMTGYRYAETMRGDTLRHVALRELGDAKFWTDLVIINGLLPPYLTDDPALVRPGVVLTGDTILIPAPQENAALTEDPDEVFGADILLNNGRLDLEGGDFKVSTGLGNLIQQIRHRLSTEKQALMFHPRYGCYTHLLRGRGNGPILSQLAAFYVRSALLEDPRISEVPRCETSVDGDVLRINADAIPVSGSLFTLDLVV